MKIVTYAAGLDGPIPPETHYALARILLTDGFLPVLFRGRTEDEARAQAQAFWDAEEAKQSARKPIAERISRLDPVQPEAPPADDLEGLFE